MRLHVNAGFSEPISPEVWKAVNLVSTGIRTGPAVNDGARRIRPLVENVLTYSQGKEAIFLVGGWDWRDLVTGQLYQDRAHDLVPWSDHLANQCGQIIHDWRALGGEDRKLWIEFGNELDLTDGWKKNIGGFFSSAMQSYDRIRSLSQDVGFITGSTSNWRKKPWGSWRSPRGFEIIRELCDYPWPEDTIQGLHPYRNDRIQGTFHDWDLVEGIRELDYLLDGRRVAITEMGWHSGGPFDDIQIAQFIRSEIDTWAAYGAVLFVYYQIQDAAIPNNFGEGGFGCYTSAADGLRPKAVRAVLAQKKGELS